jgi:hypothetical protein
LPVYFIKYLLCDRIAVYSLKGFKEWYSVDSAVRIPSL